MIKPSGFNIKDLVAGFIALFVAVVMFPSVVTALQALAVSMAPRLYALSAGIGVCAIPLGWIVHHSPAHKKLGQEMVIAGLIAAVVGFGGVATATSIAHFGAGMLQGAAGKL